jgi:hypothetical protein
VYWNFVAENLQSVEGGRTMQQHFVSICRFLLVGLLGCIAIALAESPHAGEAQEGQRQADAVCRGFVVLPHGFAVLSGLHVHPAPGSAGAQHKAAQQGATMADKGHTSSTPQHLMGYIHGQEIVPQAGMLCVPVGSPSALTWTAVGHAPALIVIAESLNGALTHGSHAHATFALTVHRDGAPVDAAQVRLLTRMPSHDRQMPGGHGPANDPDVQGIAAQPVGQGRYTIPTVDFTMGGPWLFEVQVHEGSETRKAYFAASIGEE